MGYNITIASAKKFKVIAMKYHKKDVSICLSRVCWSHANEFNSLRVRVWCNICGSHDKPEEFILKHLTNHKE